MPIGAYARGTDPETSHVAAETLGEGKNILEGIVRDALVEAGIRGLTVGDISNRTGIPRDSLSPRMRPLIKKGFVVKALNESGEMIKRVPRGYRVPQLVFRSNEI